MGMDDDQDGGNVRHRGMSSDNGSRVTVDEESLIEGLPMWLDRLFEGSTRRYQIDYWPEMPMLNAAQTANLAAKKRD
jgi:hypothetical protein